LNIISFNKFVGNTATLGVLLDSSLTGKLPHALIFTGPDGVGKFSIALSLSALFLCDNRKDGSFCGQCRQCRLIEAGTHPDLHIIQLAEDKKEIGIDSIRDLISIIHKKPFLAASKAVIIDQADIMTEEASNALLKILEEPPGDAHLFLVTSKPASLLPTIRSRSQLFRFSAISSIELEKFLVQRGYSSAEARIASRLSNGSVADLLKWDEKKFEEVDYLLKYISEIIKEGNYLSIADLVGRLASGRKEFDTAMGYCYSVFRDLLLIKTGSDPLLLINKNREDELKSISGNIRTDKLLDILGNFDRWLLANGKNLNLKMNSEDFVIQLAFMRE
jgi:DNA polymerase-3 subunit delta'